MVILTACQIRRSSWCASIHTSSFPRRFRPTLRREKQRAIPIVMATGADPVGFGLVASLSHPGGNVTGARPGGTLPHHPVARSHGHRDVADAGAGRMRACAISCHAYL